MPAKVVCPTCHISLNAPDDLLGQSVRCEECGTTFTARAPAKSRRRDDEDDDDRRPRRSKSSSRFEDDDADDRPRRRPRKKAAGSGALPFVLAGGGLVLFVLIGVGVGLYFVFAGSKKPDGQPFQPAANNNPGGFAPLPAAAPLPNDPPPVAPAAPPAPGNQPPAAGAQKVTLSNPRWSGGFSDFQVDYQINGGGRLIGLYRLKWKHADGSGGDATLTMGPFEGGNGTWKIRVIGAMGRGRRGGMEIWVEEGGGGFIPGTKVSNSVTLN